MSRYSKWAEKEHSERRRIAVLIPAGVLFLFLLPLGVIRGGAALDRALGWEGIHPGIWNLLAGGLLILAGMFFALWSIGMQFTEGMGTPLPMMPTRELLTRGPFKYCRNPMTLGTILAYLGLALIGGTYAGMALVLCFGMLLIIYLKVFEEKELAERFGPAYLEYRREVPFILPRLPRKN